MPPNSVTAHNGMDSKNPTFSTASMISCGMTVSDVAPSPAVVMMFDMIQWGLGEKKPDFGHLLIPGLYGVS